MATNTQTRLLEWLLDLDRIRLDSGAPVALQWQAPFVGWILLTFGILLTGYIVLVYRREHRDTGYSGRWRWLLPALLRGAVCALLVIVLCQPTLVLQRERIEPSQVVLLVDTSASMSRREAYRDAALATAVATGAGLTDPAETNVWSRWDLARRALLGDEARALRAVFERHEVRLVTFDSEVQARGLWKAEPDLAAEKQARALADSLDSLKAAGVGTDLPGALLRLLGSGGPLQVQRLAAVVLVSDGRTTVPSTLSGVISAARARNVPIIPLRCGSPAPPIDIALGQVVAEENVFLKDLAAIRAEVSAIGVDAPTAVALRLIDLEDGSQVASELVELGPNRPAAPVEFRFQPQRVGPHDYRLEATPLPVESETANNVERVAFNVMEDRLAILYVEGYPRFEYRYLKNALLREETIQSSILLLSADTEFAQEGTEPIRRFPETIEELRRYDVVLLGDVNPAADWLSSAQADLLVEFVGQFGGGLAVIAGQRHAPHDFRGTPLERLVPVRIDPGTNNPAGTSLTTAYQPTLTPEGWASPIFRFDPDLEVSRTLFESLPGLFWAAPTPGLRPGAEVLAEHPTLTSDTGRLPIVVRGRYGAGKVLYLGTDDTWRWRRHSGEFLHDTYWVNLCRLLMRSADTGADRRLVVRANRRALTFGERVDVRIEVRDAQLLATLESELQIAVLDAQGIPQSNLTAQRLDPTSNVFEASFVPRETGSYALVCRDVTPQPGRRPATASIRVENADAEGQRPEADHVTLARLAERTGGQFIDLDELPEALGGIPDRSVAIPDDLTEPLWDSKLVLLLFVSMITMEWVLRKAFGML